MKIFIALWAIAAVFYLGWYISLEERCDGIVRDNWLGIPSCYAAGEVK